ncbi:MAG: hypothetical protein ABI689_02030, partial [Thermoanaerobaculia bacterium]
MARRSLRIVQFTAFAALGSLWLLPPMLGGGAAGLPVSPAVEPEGVWVGLERAGDAARKVDPQGRYVVAVEDREGYGQEELWSLPADDRAPIRLASAPAGGEIQAFRISPDGALVAFISGDGTAQQLFVVPIDGGTVRRIDADRPPGAAIERFAFRDDSAALGWAIEGGAAGDVASPPNIVQLTMIFNNGFESGDSSAWSDTTPNVCPAPTGGPTNHANAVPPGAVWTANGSPHIFTANVQVPVGVTLTIAPCAEVRIPANMYLEVDGSLVAHGTPLSRITIHRNAAGAFQSIWVRSTGFGDLSFLDLDGGGSSSLNAALYLEGTGAAGVPRAKLDHVKITGSGGYGVYLTAKAELAAGSRDLVISGAGATSATAPFPMRLSVNAAGSVPTGAYTGNASDFLQVEGGTLAGDTTFHDRGVPYQIGSAGATFGVLQVDGGASLATLTIEAGVEMRFYSVAGSFGGLFVGPGSTAATGRMIAAGTAAAPILFTATGVAPPAGTWEGV